VRRLLLRIGERGDCAMIHGLRGRPSNRRPAAQFEQKILARVRQRYADFGPTLAVFLNTCLRWAGVNRYECPVRA
jgi:hypothetical protein